MSRRMIPPPTSQTTGEPSWRYRRIVIFAIILFCFWRLIALHDASDTALNYGLMLGYSWLLGLTALYYVGFATAQDLVAMVVAWSGRPYAPPVGKVETTETRTTVVDPDPPPGYAP